MFRAPVLPGDDLVFHATRKDLSMDAIRKALVLVLGTLAAQAAIAAQGVSVSTDGSLAPCADSNNTGALLSVTCSSPPLTATATGLADYRHLGAYSSALVATEFVGGVPNNPVVLRSSVIAGSGDVLTVSSAGRTGTALLNFTMNLFRTSSLDVDAVGGTDGVYAISSNAYGSTYARADLTVGGQRIVHVQEDSESVQAYYDQPVVRGYTSLGTINGTPVANALGSFQYSVPISLGDSFTLTMALYAQVSADSAGDAAAGAAIDAMNSFDWGGIQSVTVDGQPIEFAVVSMSGTDWTEAYTSAVPEAPTLALVLIGLVSMGLRRAGKGSPTIPVK
jgi:hypothetical protein